MTNTQSNSELAKLLSSVEWYDNSTLETIDRCKRKAFWRNIFTLPASQQPKDEMGKILQTSGISDSVGHAANFGTCIHSALDKYYAKIYYSTKTTQQRRIMAIRSFVKKHQTLFPDPEVLNSPYLKRYSLHRGVDLLDMYFDHYSVEDDFFRPVETELCVVTKISYNPNTDPYPFEPFYYVTRSDDLRHRVSFGDYWITEHKTAGSPANKLDELRIGRQVRGYYYNLSQFDIPIEGILANVISTQFANEDDPSKLFFRDMISLSKYDAELFRIQTIHKVESWRRVKKLASSIPTGPMQIAAFDQTTAECTRYGRCTYFDLCLYGPEGTNLNKFLPNTWNPLMAEKAEE